MRIRTLKKIIVDKHEVDTGDHYLARCPDEPGLTVRATTEKEARFLLRELLEDLERDNAHIAKLHQQDRTF